MLQSFPVSVRESVLQLHHPYPIALQQLHIFLFYHRLTKSFLSTIRGGLGTIFSYKSLVEMFPPEVVPKWSGKKYQIEKPINEKDVFRGQYGAVQGERNQHIFRRACGMFKKGKGIDYIQSEVMKEAMACSPPLSEREAILALESAKRYSR